MITHQVAPLGHVTARWEDKNLASHHRVQSQPHRKCVGRSYQVLRTSRPFCFRHDSSREAIITCALELHISSTLSIRQRLCCCAWRLRGQS